MHATTTSASSSQQACMSVYRMESSLVVRARIFFHAYCQAPSTRVAGS